MPDKPQDALTETPQQFVERMRAEWVCNRPPALEDQENLLAMARGGMATCNPRLTADIFKSTVEHGDLDQGDYCGSCGLHLSDIREVLSMNIRLDEATALLREATIFLRAEPGSEMNGTPYGDNKNLTFEKIRAFLDGEQKPDA